MTVQRTQWVKPAVLVAVLVTASGLGVAAAKSGDWGHGDCGARHGGHGHKSGMFEPGRHIDGKLAFLKAELKITEQQEPAWQSFAGVIRGNAEARAGQWQARREQRREMRRNMTDDSKDYRAPALNERVDRGIQHMEQRLAAFKEMGEAAKTLYAELNAEQQEVADGLLSRRHGSRFRF